LSARICREIRKLLRGRCQLDDKGIFMLAQFRATYQKMMAPFGQVSLTLGLGPTFWTFISVLLSIWAAYLLAKQMWGWGLIFALLVNFTDAMDGAVARAGGTASKFGSVLDHTMDRFAEFFLLGGIAMSGHVPALLIYVAMFGIVMSSYVRAKAESVGGLDNCAVGWAGRQEKLIFLFVGLGLEGWFNLEGAITAAIVVIIILSYITFIQRLVYSYRQLALVDRS
jgi:phosphatidylglycerophosphate synthase